MNARRKHSAFTLTELLAVVVIIGVLVAIVAPGFVAMGKSTQLDKALYPLKSALRQARQYAMAHNTHVSVVFPCDDSSPAVNGAMLNQLYPQSNFPAQQRMMRAYNSYDHGSGEWLGPWRFLPQGVVFCGQKTPGTAPQEGEGRNILHPDPSDAEEHAVYFRPFPFRSPTSADKLPCITFAPTGAVERGSSITHMSVFLCRGVTNAESNPNPTDLEVEYIGPQGTKAFVVGIEVHPLTGEVRVKEYHPE